MRLSCLRACVHLVQFPLTLTLSCLTLVARLSSNPCESLHATATHMLSGKQKFHGQSGFFEAIMRGAVMKKVSGQAFQLDVLEKLRLPVTDDMRTRFAQMEVQRGIMPFGGATLRFHQVAGWGNAMKWLLTGDRFDATEE